MSMETGTATSVSDLLDKLNTFLLKGHSLTPSYTGTGTGTIGGIIGSATSVQETITVTFTSATAFGVVGSVTGSMGSGTVGTLFTHAKVSFTITAGGTAFANGDTIVFVMTPPWTLKRGSTVGIYSQLGTIDSGSYPRANAFDGSPTTLAAVNTTPPAWIGAQFTSATAIGKFILGGALSTSESPKDFSLEWSDNGSSWTSHQSWTNQSFTSNEQKTYTVTGSPSHAYWRINVTANVGGASWTTVSELTFFDGSLNQIGFKEFIWSAPGNANTDQIFIGARYLSDLVGGYYSLQLGGFTGYQAGVDFGLQPGSIFNSSSLRGVVLPLWNSTIPYWFIANGRRVIVIAKISTSYESAYLGFIESYASPGQWSYPLAVGGSLSFASEPATSSSSWQYTNATSNHSSFAKPIRDGNNTFSQLRLRRPDGVWTGLTATAVDAYSGSVWPYAFSMTNLKPNLDGSYPLLPIVLSESTPNVFGRLDGVWATTGNGNAVENTFTVGRETWLVVQNIFRNTASDFFAVRLD